MAIQTLERSPSMGATVGQAVGGGLSGLLTGLAEGKAQKLMQRHQTSQLASLLGPEVASFVQALPPESQKAAFQNIGSLMQLKESMGGQQPQAQQQSMTAQEEPFSPASITPEQREQLRQYIGTPEASQAHTPQELAKLTNFLMKEQQPQQAAIAQAAPAMKAQALPSDKAKLLEDIFTSPHEKREKRKLELAEEKIAQKERHFERAHEFEREETTNKETLPVYTAVNKAAKAAVENDKRLQRMKVLINNGKLPTGTFAAGIKTLSNGIMGYGIDLSSLLDADAQEFDKLSTDFLKNIQDVFGSRILKTEVDNYLKTIPNLSQSDAGKARVINNLEQFNEAQKIRKQAMDALIKSNKGRRPANLESLIDEVAAPKLDAIADRFNKEVSEDAASGGVVNDLVENAKYIIGLRSTNPYKKKV